MRQSVSLYGAPDRAMAYALLTLDMRCSDDCSCSPTPPDVIEFAREAERWHLAWESRRRYARQRRAAA